jgi:CobQ-like glutamine amidotransferase family enzyme
MKIIEAINRIDSLKHNTYTQSEKVSWLSEVDLDVKNNVIDTHEGADKEQAITEYIQANITAHEEAVVEYMKVNEVSREEAEANVEFQEIKYKEAKEHIETTRNDIFFTGYDDRTDLQTELLIPAPYDKAYLLWMEAQIHYYNGEYDKYNNATDMFYEAYNGFKNHYNRTHMPKGKKFKFF